MTWHETDDDDATLIAIETVAHWVGADINTIFRSLAALEPRRVAMHEIAHVLEPRTTKRTPGEPVDLTKWDVVVTEHLPIVLRHRRGTVEVWRSSVVWQGVAERFLQMVDEPIVVTAAEGDESQQTKRLLKAVAIQRTKQARRSTVCTWCGDTMVKGERFSTYCCHSCASTVQGIVY